MFTMLVVFTSTMCPLCRIEGQVVAPKTSNLPSLASYLLRLPRDEIPLATLHHATERSWVLPVEQTVLFPLGTC